MPRPEVISWLPPAIASVPCKTLDIRAQEPPDCEQHWVCVRPERDQWATVASKLRSAGRTLKALPVADIVAAIDRVAVRWCDPTWPLRRATRDRIAQATGSSAATIDHSLDFEMRNYRAESLWRVLRREFTDPLSLDAPRRDEALGGRGVAIGPDLVLALLTGNVPGLPALSLVRSLLVKAPVIAKVASGEPSFAAAFAASLHEESPTIGAALLVTYWDQNEQEVLKAIAHEADVVIAYGSNAAMRAFRSALPPHVRMIEHGHKLSVSYLASDYVAKRGLTRIAQAVAQDVAVFNQHACIAPQACFVQGNIGDARIFAAALSRELATLGAARPVGEIRALDASRLRLLRTHQAWQSTGNSARDIWHGDGLEWTILLDERLSDSNGIGYRTLRVIPVDGVTAMQEQLQPFRNYLQNVGVGCMPADLASVTMMLAALGASRVCEPGRMGEPSLMWRHDGRACLADMVRWCDVEMHAALDAWPDPAHGIVRAAATVHSTPNHGSDSDNVPDSSSPAQRSPAGPDWPVPL